ncbi:hypothetical protein BKH41_07960 [Helicobacter sp. 12S02232-10]|uniref:hypothetical protein n=1 Tax=Helicobacter sp. 12S02232-10 TaxID=1476197 RepID=UPI000BA56D60|nr:hypothetical protein [Helicobacter sp. 12S02232-10]PAF47206.1 hypothetical protein BKH41_07960 [Helicobacter sp. 12S02232-10]
MKKLISVLASKAFLDSFLAFSNTFAKSVKSYRYFLNTKFFLILEFLHSKTLLMVLSFICTLLRILSSYQIINTKNNIKNFLIFIKIILCIDFIHIIDDIKYKF